MVGCLSGAALARSLGVVAVIGIRATVDLVFWCNAFLGALLVLLLVLLWAWKAYDWDWYLSRRSSDRVTLNQSVGGSSPPGVTSEK